jgi:plastocyanin
MRSRSLSALAIGWLAALVTSHPAMCDPAASSSTIVIERFAFIPAEISAPVGAQIVFLNHDQAPHAVVGENGSGEIFRSPEHIDEDETFSIRLLSPGEIEFHCGVHSAMKGKITVTK